MADEIKRLHYYDQQFLREPDFTDEQKYHMGMRRRHNRVLHGWGIVEDLSVVIKNSQTVTVQTGMALDADGREIILGQAQDIAIPGGPSNANASYYITIKYKLPEDLTDPPPPQYMIDPSDRTRVTERPEFPAPAAALPVDQSRTLVLGNVVLNASGNIMKIKVGDRKYAPKGKNGKLGVGTLDPLFPLHVTAQGGFGNENADGTSQAGNVPLVVQSDSTVFGALNASGRQAFALNIENGSSSSQRGTPVFYDKYDGNWHSSIYLKNGKVGIGTQDPGAKLEIMGSGGASIDFKVNGRLQSNNNDGGLYIASDRFVGGHSTDKIGFWNGNAWRLTVQSNGNVGIGINDPQSKLHVNGDTFSAGNVTFGGASPAASVGFRNTLTPANIVKAWGMVKTGPQAGSNRAILLDGFNIEDVQVDGSSFATITLKEPLSGVICMAGNSHDLSGGFITLVYNSGKIIQGRGYVIDNGLMKVKSWTTQTCYFSFMVIGNQ